ncbi:BSD domain-containing protein [Cryptosporidium muris RN66]|uniref:BSD domain-containing protein n=1 Tax=Cryptosporidium muris (strain RN66) TaxID=441375 RepID=B6ABL5_CRYMR|nr:BSD domain-containing protein [Cryptosporidium muris RN66]EEA05767.1 BSD domain-containing protein [Cryptosporidium muris RN66]|eukprot:XP_002140116.1 BSD domain-containing protein [Cryptosporidium muris RN66]
MKLEILKSEDLQKVLTNVLIKKVDGNIYITTHYIIWVPSTIKNQPFDNINSIISLSSEETDEIILEPWQELYAHRHRLEKRLLGLRFKKNEEGFTDINMVLKDNLDLDILIESIQKYHDASLKKLINSNEESVQVNCSQSNRNVSMEVNNSIPIEKEAKQDIKVRKEFFMEKKKKIEKKERTLHEKLKGLLDLEPDLRSVYTNLVLTGQVSLESFIEHHIDKIELNKEEEVGPNNVDSFLKKPPKMSHTNSGGIDVTVTAEELNAILEEFPIIKYKMSEYVPHRLTEQEFWNRIIQSPLFFDILGRKSEGISSDNFNIGNLPEGKDLLYELNNLESGGFNEILSRYVDKDINLLPNIDYTKCGFGTSLGSASITQNLEDTSKNLLERFNRHGAHILELTIGMDKLKSSLDINNDIVESHNDQVIENKDIKNQISNLNIDPKSFFSIGIEGENEMKNIVNNVEDNLNMKQDKISSIGDPNFCTLPESSINIFSDIGRLVLIECTKQLQQEQVSQLSSYQKSTLLENFSSQQLNTFQNSQYQICSSNKNNEDFPVWFTQIKKEFLEVNELLSHFWKSTLTPKSIEKRRRLINTLDNVAQNIESLVHDNSNISITVVSSYGQPAGTLRSMCLPILESIKTARKYYYKLEDMLSKLQNTSRLQ